MPHMVIFRSVEGKPGYHQAETLDDAVRFVERLRNQEQIPEMRIFRMQEVPIEFKPYYRVEVMSAAEDGAMPGPAPAPVAPAAASAVPSPAAPAAPVAPVAAAEDKSAPADEPVAGVSEPVMATPGAARFGRFNRG